MKAKVNRRTMDNTANLVWTFGDTQHWGEQSNGTWTLQVADRADGNTGTFDSATVTIYGTSTTPPTGLGNISTWVSVQTGDEVAIGGFIIAGKQTNAGTQPKKVIIEGKGPSLGKVDPPVAGALADPSLELHNSDGSILATNDDWRDTQEADIIATTIPPTDGLESAIVATLPPGPYTAIVFGFDGSTGDAVVEAYALAPAP